MSHSKSPGDFIPENWLQPGDKNMGAAYARWQASYEAWMRRATPAQRQADEQEVHVSLGRIEGLI